MKTIYCTVSNDLSYDQRMHRICDTLARAGYRIILVGRKLPESLPLTRKSFLQTRLRCLFRKGKIFYCEYNLRLFFYLVFKKPDAICSIDLDTILAGLLVSKLKKVARIYDAHELFSEMKEVVSRPSIYQLWKKIERFAVPKFTSGYTVSPQIADLFRKWYAVDYAVIRNLPKLERGIIQEKKSDKYILYQGAVNQGRSFETLIPAFKAVKCRLIICGDGNFMNDAKKLVAENDLAEQISFTGMVEPEELKVYTLNATIGITLFEKTGLSNYYSLANRFFDYIHAGIPQICVDYPAYREINDRFPVAVLISDLSIDSIVTALNNLLENTVLHKEMQAACVQAREVYNWQTEESKLLAFYEHLFHKSLPMSGSKSK